MNIVLKGKIYMAKCILVLRYKLTACVYIINEHACHISSEGICKQLELIRK